ncbi:MAG: ACP phosphodiesterase [Pseudomonadales bacterium]
MNYLAHFHLAGTNENYIVGALLGDFVKGSLAGSELPAEINTGIKLHRQIDGFTQRQPSVDKKTYDGQWRRYGGILEDVISDYFLSRAWSDYHPRQLEQYADDVYHILQTNNHHLNEKALNFAQRMSEYNLLCRYRDWSSIDRTLTSIGQRLKRDNPLHQAADYLWPHRAQLEDNFHADYPALITFATQWRDNQ